MRIAIDSRSSNFWNVYCDPSMYRFRKSRSISAGSEILVCSGNTWDI